MKHEWTLFSLAAGALLSASLLGSPAMAQSGPVINQPALAVAATEYRIAPEDVLNINVVNFPEDTTPQAMVTPDGNVTVPPVGVVHIAGKTTDEAAALLTKKYKVYLKYPLVTVGLVQKHVENVVFTGWVTKPEAQPYIPGMHLLEYLANVGGAQPNGDLSKTTVTHADGTKQVLNLDHPELKAGTPDDILLQKDDVVYVPQSFDEIDIVGEVNKPGSLSYTDGLTVMEAITQAGSTKDDADLNAATITHNGTTRKLDLYAMLLKGDMTDNIKLASGDRINVPLGNRLYIYGDVYRPGFYYFRQGDRMADALGNAGGPTPLADLGKINVIHIDKVQETATMHRVSLNDYLLLGKYSGNPVLQPGDALYIPDQRHQVKFSDLFSVLRTVDVADTTTRVLSDR